MNKEQIEQKLIELHNSLLENRRREKEILDEIKLITQYKAEPRFRVNDIVLVNLNDPHWSPIEAIILSVDQKENTEEGVYYWVYILNRGERYHQTANMYVHENYLEFQALERMEIADITEGQIVYRIGSHIPYLVVAKNINSNQYSLLIMPLGNFQIVHESDVLIRPNAKKYRT